MYPPASARFLITQYQMSQIEKRSDYYQALKRYSQPQQNDRIFPQLPEWVDNDLLEVYIQFLHMLAHPLVQYYQFEAIFGIETLVQWADYLSSEFLWDLLIDHVKTTPQDLRQFLYSVNKLSNKHPRITQMEKYWEEEHRFIIVEEEYMTIEWEFEYKLLEQLKWSAMGDEYTMGKCGVCRKVIVVRQEQIDEDVSVYARLNCCLQVCHTYCLSTAILSEHRLTCNFCGTFYTQKGKIDKAGESMKCIYNRVKIKRRNAKLTWGCPLHILPEYSRRVEK